MRMVALNDGHVSPALFDDGFCEQAGMDRQESHSAVRFPQTVKPEQTVFLEGDAAENIYVVREGVVQIYKILMDGRRQITGFIYPGQVIGMAFRGEYAYAAEAVTDVKLDRYPRHRLDQLIKEQPAIARRMLQVTVDELAAAQDQMLLLGRKDASEKLASFFLRLSDINEESGDDPARIYLPMRRREIGDYLGLTIETVSRTITSFKADGLIRCATNNTVELTNMDALIDLAQGDRECL